MGLGKVLWDSANRLIGNLIPDVPNRRNLGSAEFPLGDIFGNPVVNGATKSGTVVVTGASAKTVTTTGITANSVVVFGLKTAGGTIAGQPYMSAVTPGTSFAVKAGASDTSTYNYWILG